MMIINDQQIDPIPVIIGKAKYPEDILNKIKSNYDNIITVDGLSIVKKCGTIKAVNTVLIGIMAASLDLPKSEWLDSVKAMVPDRFIDVNIKAFEEGYNITF